MTKSWPENACRITGHCRITVPHHKAVPGNAVRPYRVDERLVTGALLVVTGALLVGTGALLVVTRSY